MSNPIQSFDDVLPNDGSAFDASFVTPPEQEKEERQAKDKAASYLPIIDELIAEYENDIKEADSMIKLGINASMPQVQVQILVEGNTKYIAKLTEKLETYKAMKEAAQG